MCADCLSRLPVFAKRHAAEKIKAIMEIDPSKADSQAVSKRYYYWISRAAWQLASSGELKTCYHSTKDVQN